MTSYMEPYIHGARPYIYRNTITVAP